jgi:hypothetical protein
MDLILRFSRDRTDRGLATSSYEPDLTSSANQIYNVSVDFAQDERQTPPVSVSVTIPRKPSAWPDGSDGAQLLWQLLPAQAQGLISTSPEAVQLFVESGDPTIDLLPWELLPGLGTAASGLSVARLVPFLLKPPPLSVVPPLRLLIVASNAKDERSFSDRETVVLRSAMKAGIYEVREMPNATAASAGQVIREFDPHIVHYVGHGGTVAGEGAIILRDESSGTTNWIRAGQVSQILPVSTRLLCLSTGFSQRNFDITGLVNFAHSPSSVRLPTCIINRSDVDETGIASFWTGFYDGLSLSDGNVLRAFNDSLRALRAQNASMAAAASFSLILRDGAIQPLRLTKHKDPKRYSAEVQAQFAARLASDLNDKLKSFGGTEPSSALQDSFSEERSRFTTFSSIAASLDSE